MTNFYIRAREGDTGNLLGYEIVERIDTVDYKVHEFRDDLIETLIIAMQYYGLGIDLVDL